MNQISRPPIGPSLKNTHPAEVAQQVDNELSKENDDAATENVGSEPAQENALKGDSLRRRLRREIYQFNYGPNGDFLSSSLTTDGKTFYYVPIPLFISQPSGLIGVSGLLIRADVIPPMPPSPISSTPTPVHIPILGPATPFVPFSHNIAPGGSTSVSLKGIVGVSKEYRQFMQQINNMPRTGVYRPEYLTIPQFNISAPVARRRFIEFLNQINNALKRAISEKWIPWRLEYEMAALWEEYGWHRDPKKAGPREPRLQALAEFKNRLEQHYNGQAAKEIEEAVNKLKQQAAAHNWRPWDIEYAIATIREQCEWNYFAQYQNVPRGPRWDRLLETKNRVFRERANAENWKWDEIDYHLETFWEEHDWHDWARHQNVPREPRIQRILDNRINRFKQRATAEKLAPWAIEYEVESQKEDFGWWRLGQHNEPREQRLQRLAELKQRLEREYNERLQAPKVVQAKQEHQYEYTDGLITKITDPLGQTAHQDWYQAGDTSPGAYPRSLKQYTDRRGLVTQFKYNTTGNVIEKNVVGDMTGDGVSNTATTKFAYNRNNLLTSVIDPLGNEIAIFYEDSNNPRVPTRIERKVQGQIVFDIRNTAGANSQAAQNFLQKLVLAAGTPEEAIVEYQYNEQGLLTNQKTTGTGSPTVTTQFEYNPSGELIKQIDDFGISLYNHDPLKKQIRMERKNKANHLIDGQVIHYNDNGELTQIDQFNPDLTGSTTAERSPYATTYKHDRFGNLVEVKRPESHPIKMTYDAMGQMLTRSYQNDADSSKVYTEKFTYGPGGEIATYTNPQGGETKYFYTTDGKLHRRQNPDGTVQQWRYSLDGRLTKEIQPDGSYWETNYNDRERNISRVKKDSSHKTLSQESYTFDRRGNVISYTDAQNKTITRQYDGLNRLTAETTLPEKPGEPQQRTNIAYSGNTVTITNAQGEKQIITQDALGRATSILTQGANNQKVSETKYAYTPGKISVTETKGSITTTTFPKNIAIPLLRLGKQETAINDAKLAIPMIGVSMGLGGIGTAAKKLGLKSVGNTFDGWSVSLLQNAADRLSATNEGPMGRVFDTLIHSTMGFARPVFGHNQPFLEDWTTGDLPTRIVYPPDSIQVRNMMESSNVKRAVDKFYADGAPKEGITFRHDTFEAFRETIADPFTRNLKSTAMQVGGYAGATITNNGNGTMTIRITNVAGANSFFYHLLPNLPGNTGPMHDVEQVFEWTMPIDRARLPKPINK